MSSGFVPKLVSGSVASSQRAAWCVGAGLLAALTIGGAGGCSGQRVGLDDDETVDPTKKPSPDQPVGTIRISPDPVNLTVSGMAQTVAFKAVSSKLGDITDVAAWSLSDPSIGSVTGGKLTVGASVQRGGSYKVYASYGTGNATAIVNLKLIAPEVVDASAPADAKDWFPGGAGGPAPKIVYPFDNTMMAPNVLQLGVQWQAGSGQTLFRVLLSGPTYERSFYVGSSKCPGGKCTFNVDDMVWNQVGHSSLDQTVTMTVQGVASKGGPMGESSPIRIKFAPEDVKGGLYYFSPTIRGIKRVPLGASKPVDFIRNGDETGCAGCHAVSRDGKQVAVEYGSGNTSVGSGIVDGADPKKRNWRLTPSFSWTFSWFNPTGDKIITNWIGALTVRNAATGQPLQTVTTAQIGGPGGAMPEWSPDGRYIAFVRLSGSPGYDFELQNSGDIVVMPYNNGAFGPAVELVHGQPGKEVHFWPSWSPDSKWIVFNSMTCSGGACAQYDAVTTRLRLVRAIDDSGNPTVGPTPIELAAGTHAPNNSNNWPKFAPFLLQGRYVFVVYSAKYPWGFSGGSVPQLFMFGLDLDRAKADQDPSFQPFWLPFQETNTGNHSAIWTTDVVCTMDKDCPAEFQCMSNMCVPRIG